MGCRLALTSRLPVLLANGVTQESNVHPSPCHISSNTYSFCHGKLISFIPFSLVHSVCYQSFQSRVNRNIAVKFMILIIKRKPSQKWEDNFFCSWKMEKCLNLSNCKIHMSIIKNGNIHQRWNFQEKAGFAYEYILHPFQEVKINPLTFLVEVPSKWDTVVRYVPSKSFSAPLK